MLLYDHSLNQRGCVCAVLVVVGADAGLDESSVDDVRQTEDRIVSQWKEVSADEQHELRDKFDEILRPLGLKTRLVVVERDNSLAMYFICMALSAVMSLRDQWSNGQLKDIVQALFAVLSRDRVRVSKLSWPLSDYERCLSFFSFEQGQ